MMSKQFQANISYIYFCIEKTEKCTNRPKQNCRAL